ncbi:Uncharacterized membrane protein YsdA, DUF1294 family [Desulforhopalus singaporensis]|uniref:Uncharacterized membrane protein YsdA, DUF1294 family n=2 Tax=Desulforhopalus singaporensis TaxID=91360 RepID=A0A1H0VH11_9BACT|nr:Uncharacterized membrane protein YsdA, DUF1294 family [Desulforhopalus singaporensis]
MDRQTGTVSKWSEEKGFGFITADEDGESMFFHINDYSHRHKRPIKNLKVQYYISSDPKGRTCAIDVAPVEGHKNNGRELKQKSFSLLILGSFSLALYFLFTLKLIPSQLIYCYALMSVVTFIMYAKDKSAAGLGRWRTPERTLHILSLLGGWPGAKIAQSFLRHKSKKISFRVTYWITVIMNCGALYWLTTPQGSLYLHNILKNIKPG